MINAKIKTRIEKTETTTIEIGEQDILAALKKSNPKLNAFLSNANKTTLSVKYSSGDQWEKVEIDCDIPLEIVVEKRKVDNEEIELKDKDLK